MANMLTREQFKSNASLPFTTVEVHGTNNFSKITEWIEDHCNDSWTYWDGDKTYIFGSSGDSVLFRMWIQSDPFS